MRAAGGEGREAASFLLGSSAFSRKSFLLPGRARQAFWEVSGDAVPWGTPSGSSPRERLDA